MIQGFFIVLLFIASTYGTDRYPKTVPTFLPLASWFHLWRGSSIVYQVIFLITTLTPTSAAISSGWTSIATILAMIWRHSFVSHWTPEESTVLAAVFVSDVSKTVQMRG